MADGEIAEKARLVRPLARRSNPTESCRSTGRVARTERWPRDRPGKAQRRGSRGVAVDDRDRRGVLQPLESLIMCQPVCRCVRRRR